MQGEDTGVATWGSRDEKVEFNARFQSENYTKMSSLN